MNRKDGYADLDKWRETCKRQTYRYYNKTANAPNSYNRLTLAEIQMILEHKMTDHELSKILGRSVRAIQVARSRYRDRDKEM